MKQNELELRQRFVNDFNIPIQVLESPYFEYFLSLYENHLGTETKWDELNKLIETKYNGNNSIFLEEYYKVRNFIIKSIEESPSYLRYNSYNMSEYAVSNIEFNSIPKSSVYIEQNDQKIFLSVDLKQANFYALKYHNNEIVRFTLDYDGFINVFLGSGHPLIKYFQDSKYTRQIIFGKLNMSRNITIQKYIMSTVYERIKNAMKELDINCFVPYSFNTDEIIFEYVKDDEFFKLFGKSNSYTLEKYLNMDFLRFELYKVGFYKFENINGNKIPIYIKSEFPFTSSLEGECKIKMCPITYYAQVHKLLLGQQIIENDLLFYHEKQLAKFLNPISLVN
jgi:hypothetical protein